MVGFHLEGVHERMECAPLFHDGRPALINMLAGIDGQYAADALRSGKPTGILFASELEGQRCAAVAVDIIGRNEGAYTAKLIHHILFVPSQSRQNVFQAVKLHIHDSGAKLIGAKFAAAEAFCCEVLHLIAEEGHGAAVMVDQSAFKKKPVIRKQSAALSAGDDLKVIKAQRAGIADGSQSLTPEAAAVSLAGIFQNQQVVPLRNIQDGIHVAREALNMDRNDGLGMRGDLPFDVFGRNGKRVIHFRNDRDRTCGDHCHGRCDIGIGRNDHFIPGTDAHSYQRRCKRRMAAGHENGMLTVKNPAKLIFHIPGFLQAGVHFKQIACLDHSGQFRNFLLTHSIHNTSSLSFFKFGICFLTSFVNLK